MERIFSGLASYHSARAEEEAKLAASAAAAVARTSHMELHRLHLTQANWLSGRNANEAVADRGD
jgi:hypothetical protein